MTQFIEFLTNYWKQLFDVVAIIISVIICLIRKRPVLNEIDVIKEDILGVLPLFINSVEHPGDGSKKLSDVITLVSAYVKKKYSIEIDGSLLNYIRDSIENILSTPTKKGE